MASTLIQRTPSGGNRKKWTWSAWIKFSAVPSANTYLWSGYSGSNNTGYLSAYFDNDSQLNIGAWTVVFFNTKRVFRDINAWYHILLRASTTDGTAQDRMKLYINGVQETSFSTNTTASSSLNTHVNQSGNALKIGIYTSGSNYFDGLMSHFHLADGTAYEPSTFGETDSTTGEWKIKTSPSVSYGTNGFFILKDGNSVTDQSGQSNNLTVGGGTLTKSEDCPSNVFATFNHLDWENRNIALTNGNGTATNTDTANWQAKYAMSTLAMSAGKYYAEFKAGTISGTKYNQFGVVHEDIVSSGTFQYVGDSTSGWGLNWGGNVNHNGSNVSGYTSFTTGDIIGVAMDLDNHKVYWRKNDGAWLNSGDPTSGSTGTGAQSLTTGKIYFFAASVYGNECFANFGNGYFGTTAVSSAGTNASGIGIFEYDVPTGFTAWSTKGLNE